VSEKVDLTDTPISSNQQFVPQPITVIFKHLVFPILPDKAIFFLSFL